jgi:hypothetical protein
MDGLSALSIAGSVAQFIEFSCSLVAKSKEIYASAHGAPLRRIELESATQRLVELSERIRTAAQLQTGHSSSISTKDQALDGICQGCLNVSSQLLSKLNTLKVPNDQNRRGYQSFVKH